MQKEEPQLGQVRLQPGGVRDDMQHEGLSLAARESGSPPGPEPPLLPSSVENEPEVDDETEPSLLPSSDPDNSLQMDGTLLSLLTDRNFDISILEIDDELSPPPSSNSEDDEEEFPKGRICCH